MNSILNYIGQKNLNYLEQRDLDIIHDSQVYCEPFSGSFNLGIQLIDKGVIGVNTHKIVLNDLDERVYNFWRWVSIDYMQLMAKITELKEINTEDLLQIKYKDSIEMAAIEFLYRVRKRDRKIKFNIDEYICEFCIQSEYMKRIEINNKKYKEIILELDSKSTFLFIDPPYINVRNINDYYRCESNKFNHKELMDTIKNMNSKFILTYNNDKEIQSYYREYNIRKLNRVIYGKNYTELIISNF